MSDAAAERDWSQFAASVKAWATECGFQSAGIADADVSGARAGLTQWLRAGWHGEMDYLSRHSHLRVAPASLHPGTLRVISCRMNYVPDLRDEWPHIGHHGAAYIARYARGRDYHKVLRSRLQRLCMRMQAEIGPFGYRVFTDSAPVMEVEFAARAGLGWRGKHTLLLSRDAGSWFFLGEIYTDLPLPVDAPIAAHCGSCVRCIDVCPTQAIRAPYRLDARRCISYLTIELKGSIPEDLRPLIGNRVFGCDDCQLVCPWNEFAQSTDEADFAVRNGLDAASLIELFAWDAVEFGRRMSGSAIRRIGHERWLRNLAVGLGNAAGSDAVLAALEARRAHPSPLVREHVHWAIAQHRR